MPCDGGAMVVQTERNFLMRFTNEQIVRRIEHIWSVWDWGTFNSHFTFPGITPAPNDCGICGGMLRTEGWDMYTSPFREEGTDTPLCEACEYAKNRVVEAKLILAQVEGKSGFDVDALKGEWAPAPVEGSP